MRRSAILGLLALWALAGCGWAGANPHTTKPDGFLLHGYVSVPGPSSGTAGAACASAKPDIHSGTDVKVTDDGGKALASGVLGDGVLAASGSGYRCNFPFEISNVSSSATTVVVLVGLQPAAKFSTRPLTEGQPAVIPVS